MKLNKILLTTTLVPIAVVPAMVTSCNKNNDDISITGASYDKSLSKIVLNEESTIYLIPESGKNITGIKSISVGDVVLTPLQYTIEFNANSNNTKLTINAKAMKSTKISIEVNTKSIKEIAWVSYSGSTQTNAAVLKPYTYEVVATYSDSSQAHLAVGEYKIYLDDQDITDTVTKGEGYKMNKVQTYIFTFKSTIDSTKTKQLSVKVTAPSTKAVDVNYDSLTSSGYTIQRQTTRLIDMDGWRILSFDIKAPTSKGGTFTVSVLDNSEVIQSNTYAIEDDKFTTCSFNITDWSKIKDSDTLTISVVKQ